MDTNDTNETEVSSSEPQSPGSIQAGPEETPNPEAEADIIPPLTPVETQPAPANGFVYFKKVLANMPLFFNRQRVEVELLAQNTGVLRLDRETNGPLIATISAMAAANRGGWVAIDEATYHGLKKKLPPLTLEQRSRRPKLQVWNPPRSIKPKKPSNGKAAAPAAVAGENKQLSSPTGSASVGVRPVSGSRPGGESTGETPPASTKTVKPALAKRGPVARPAKVAASPKSLM